MGLASLQLLRSVKSEHKQTEALRESEESLSQIVQGSAVATFVIDDEHVVTHWNVACENLTGIHADEMIGTREQWMAFYSSKRPVMADLVVDGAPEEEIASRYDAGYQGAALVEGGHKAEGFSPIWVKRANGFPSPQRH